MRQPYLCNVDRRDKSALPPLDGVSIFSTCQVTLQRHVFPQLFNPHLYLENGVWRMAYGEWWIGQGSPRILNPGTPVFSSLITRMVKCFALATRWTEEPGIVVMPQDKLYHGIQLSMSGTLPECSRPIEEEHRSGQRVIPYPFNIQNIA